MAMSSAVSQEALPHAVGLTYLTFMTSLPPDVVLGAFTGSVIFLLGSTTKPRWQWMLLFTVAFMAGLLGATQIADIGSGLLHLVGLEARVSGGMGAMVSATCVINVLGWLRDNPTAFLQKIGLKKGDEA